MRIRYVLGLFAFTMLPAALAAQGCPALQAGSTVRLYAPSAATYTLPQAVQPADSAIVLPSARTVSCADLQRVQLRTGTAARGRSALRGAGIGLLVGSVVGAGLGFYGTEEDDDGWDILGREEVAVIGAVFLGGTGAALGGVIGAVAPGSRWQDVPVTTRPARVSAEGLRITPAGPSQIRLSYTLAF